MTDHSPGKPFPLGATVCAEGVNFAVYSKHCREMQLLLFNDAECSQPEQVIDLDPKHHRTFHYWHIFIPGIKTGQHYGFRALGDSHPPEQNNIQECKTLIDPYGRAVATSSKYQRHIEPVALGTTPEAESNPRFEPAPFKSIVTELTDYDWEGDRPLRKPYSETIIYEMHVRGLTMHPNSQVSSEKRGSYLGVIEKIPYLKKLGITAVELLPIFQFDTQDAPDGLTNYWGYSPISFFAPHADYATDRTPLTAINEFREMVKALHQAEIEVILDVVYNHTAEGGSGGPEFCYKGLQNDAYYLLQEPNDTDEPHPGYANYSGCGNTLNANHSIVRRMILDSLRYWVQEMHVDGFRFDLASILSRDVNGEPQMNPPILWDIETDPILSGTKLIAEAWDAAGLYQVGHFFGDRWKEWNGHFRDDVRAFVKGDKGFAGDLTQRFLASPDIYGHRKREPEQSINFVTSHDGFTLEDLVSYDTKHNLPNGENNNDGHNENLSWNCGCEGPTADKEITQLRTQQAKNLMAINLLSFGVPMLLMGDEVRRTQNGNNNAYCQDNETSWFDWSLVQENSEMLRFVTELIQFRRQLPRPKNPQLTLPEILEPAPIVWHGTELEQPDWSEHSHSVAFTIQAPSKWYHVIFNAFWEPLEFQIPVLPNGFARWRRIMDTSLHSPEDINLIGTVIDEHFYQAEARSTVLITAENDRMGHSP